MNSHLKAIIGATLYALGVTPYAVIISGWFGIYWSVAFIAVTLFVYFKVMKNLLGG